MIVITMQIHLKYRRSSLLILLALSTLLLKSAESKGQGVRLPISFYWLLPVETHWLIEAEGQVNFEYRGYYKIELVNSNNIVRSTLVNCQQNSIEIFSIQSQDTLSIVINRDQNEVFKIVHNYMGFKSEMSFDKRESPHRILCDTMVCFVFDNSSWQNVRELEKAWIFGSATLERYFYSETIFDKELGFGRFKRNIFENDSLSFSIFERKLFGLKLKSTNGYSLKKSFRKLIVEHNRVILNMKLPPKKVSNCKLTFKIKERDDKLYFYNTSITKVN